ncbi:unnamed protein product [Onchocerca flexuosa]|uniref:Thioredoxin domain-containing protein 9 n=1 Tax=Onchocerca flexuosa TaxID=387005 RepID=A0A183I2P1_9BILA|nr:unnamed protein product [Onchocerca flexuosa]
MNQSMEKVLSEQLLKAVTLAEEEHSSFIFLLLFFVSMNWLFFLYSQLFFQEWLQNGHGVYEEIPDERSFFDATKKSAKVVCHFYLPTTERCKIVDKHLRKIAQKYMEIRFIYANAEKFPFLTTRLKIRVIPTIVVIINAKTVDYIRGFDDLGGIDEFKTETLEWRLSWTKVLEYDGPSYLRDSDMTVSKLTKEAKKKVRRSEDDNDDDW